MIRKYRKCSTAWPILAGLALLATQAVCAAPQMYDVEVIIFSAPSSGSEPERLDQPDADAAPARGGAAPANAFTELPSGAYGLNNIRGGLSASGYRVLFHRAWRQMANDRANAVDYPVHVLADNGRDSVDGRITLVKERYLHLDIDLLLKTARGNPSALYADGSGFRLSETRRIRSNELHYFDHPRFGMIARVTPYESAEQQTSPEPVGETGPEAPAPGDSLEEEPVTADDQLTR